MDKIIQRIEKELGIPNLAEIMTERIAPTDLQSLLIHVYKRVAERRKASAVLSDYVKNRFARPSGCNPSLITKWDQIAFSELPGSFQAIELSPICPLGSVSSLAPVSQDWVVSTIRHTEVIADPTNALALECAVRRQRFLRAKPSDATIVSLACSHRPLRAQRYQDPKALHHFRLFSLCSAGRDTGNLRFETHSITDHVRFYLKSLTHYLGPKVPLKVSFNDLTTDASVADSLVGVAKGVKGKFKQARLDLEASQPKTRGYYQRFRFHIYANQNGQDVELVDGGDVDWTQKLLNSAKERLVISAIGSERLCDRFGGSKLVRH
jgi:hypothetical protein